VGALVGTLVGLTGLGGGMVLLPLLISVLGVPPIIAVGSDAVINCITKVGAGALHWRLGNVNWRLVLNLAYGSIPGAICGVLFLGHLRVAYGSGVNDFLKMAIGVLLIVIPVAYLLKRSPSASRASAGATHATKYSSGISAIGFLAGVLVGVTSIGSGSVILLLLFVFYGFLPALMVGTDIVHAIILAGLTGILQFGFGNVDLVLVASVLVGSIPGGLLGAYLTRYLPSHRFKQILCTVLVVVGARMLWVSVAHAN
jgi:uncharacterized membrane protein YfcA